MLFTEEARLALLLAAILRFVIIAIIVALSYGPGTPAEVQAFDALSTLAFAPVGVLQLIIVWRRISWAWPKYLFILADTIILTTDVFASAQNGLALAFPGLVSREAMVAYSFVLLLLSMLYLSPWAILWFAFCSFVAWAIAFLVLVQLPGVVTKEDMSSDLDPSAELAFTMQPNYVDLDRLAEELILIVIVAIAAAAVVGRARAVVLRAAHAERRRGNLARYFSPMVLNELEQRDFALGEGHESEAAILFADLRDSTKLAEGLAPAEMLKLLRDFHGAMEEQVFAYRGTLEKYIGDALIASFGAVKPGSYDASHALCCAHALFAALDRVNLRRLAQNQPPIAMGVGLHFGSIVTGDIGSKRSMAFTIVGQAVNLGSRVQGLTRRFGTDIVLTAAFEAHLRKEIGPTAEMLLAGFSNPTPATVKGFEQKIVVRHGARTNGPLARSCGICRGSRSRNDGSPDDTLYRLAAS